MMCVDLRAESIVAEANHTRFVSVLGAAVSAILQSGSAALAARFVDPFYMQGVMSGQGAIGFAVALAQLLAAIQASRSGRTGQDEEDEKLLRSTSSFFLTSLLFTVIAGGAAYTLFQLPLYRKNMAVQSKDDNPDMNLQARPSLNLVNGRIQGLGLAVLGIFTVTIGLFPGITTTIASTNPDSPISSVCPPVVCHEGPADLSR